MGPGMRLQVRRIYDAPSPDDGTRVLVDRLWPRGMSKARAQLDDWCKHIPPSPELRNWYHHDPELFEEFSRRYTAELQAGEPAVALRRLTTLARAGTLTLLTATKNPELSEAAVLANLIRRNTR